MWNHLKQPEVTYSKQETTSNDLRLEMTYNEQKLTLTIWNYLQEKKKTDRKKKKKNSMQKRSETTSNEQILRLFYNVGQSVFFSNMFSPNICLQSFEHCLMEIRSKNRAPNTYTLACVFITGFNIYRTYCEPPGHL